MLNIKEGNQSSLIHFVETSKEEIENLKSKYSWDSYNPYDNLQTELSSILFDSLAGVAHFKGIDEETLFNQLTKPQKVIYALNAFEGQVDNGGIFQFFWNIPHFSLAVEQSLEEINYGELLDNFRKVKKQSG
jgi:hypothetical protein